MHIFLLGFAWLEKCSWYLSILFERATTLTIFSTEPIANMEPSFATPNNTHRLCAFTQPFLRVMAINCPYHTQAHVSNKFTAIEWIRDLDTNQLELSLNKGFLNSNLETYYQSGQCTSELLLGRIWFFSLPFFASDWLHFLVIISQSIHSLAKAFLELGIL